MPQVEIQPEIKVKSRGRERERKRERDTGGARFPRNQAERLVPETGPRSWSEKLAPGPRPLAPILYCSEGLLYF